VAGFGWLNFAETYVKAGNYGQIAGDGTAPGTDVLGVIGVAPDGQLVGLGTVVVPVVPTGGG
jgi:hypothetical protein